MPSKKIILITGIIGLLGAILTGIGEFLLHYDPLARFSISNYDFMLATSTQQQTLGHFIAVFGAPFYIVGCWHIYLMLKPAGQKLAFTAFILGSYGFIVGGDWISSRASIGALIHFQERGNDIENLSALYQLRYESLLAVVRTTTLILSALYIFLVLTGKSYYQKYCFIFSPIVLLLSSLIVYYFSPTLGKYVMPIALNVGYGLFFLMSLWQAQKIENPPKSNL